MNLTSQLHVADIRSLISAGFFWWWQGITDLIPGYRRMTTNAKKPLLLLAEYEKTTLTIPNDNAETGLAGWDKILLPSLFDELSEDTKNTLANLGGGHVVEISLPRQDILFLAMTLPKTAQFKLKEAVSLKLITESPINRDSVFFDIQTERSKETNNVTIEVALCLREKVNQVLSVLEKSAISTVKVGYSKLSNDHLDYVFYASPDIESSQSRFKKHLILLCSLVLIVTSFLPFTFLAAALIERDIRQEIKSMQKSIDENSQLLARQSLLDTIKIDLNQQIPPYRITNILNDLATALPKTSWITSLRYDNTVLQLTGNSPNIVEMMKELNKLSTLGRVKLISVANSNNVNVPSQYEVAIDLKRSVP